MVAWEGVVLIAIGAFLLGLTPLLWMSWDARRERKRLRSGRTIDLIPRYAPSQLAIPPLSWPDGKH